jgi:hypothetical protein
VRVVLESKAKMPNGRSHFRRYHDEKHSSRRRRNERDRSPHRRRRDGDELPHDLPQHPDGVDGVPTNDGFQGSGYHPDSEMQVLRGHFRRFCPSNNNNDQRSTAKRPLLAIEPKHVNFIGPSANSKFFKTMTIERRQMKCFVDFGSECSLISAAAVQLLSATPVSLETGVTL